MQNNAAAKTWLPLVYFYFCWFWIFRLDFINILVNWRFNSVDPLSEYDVKANYKLLSNGSHGCVVTLTVNQFSAQNNCLGCTGT